MSDAAPTPGPLHGIRIIELAGLGPSQHGAMLLAGAVVDVLNPRAAIAICGGLTLGYGIVWHLITRRVARAEAVTAPSLA